MIIKVNDQILIANHNFITFLKYRSAFGRGVFDCTEPEDLLGLLWIGLGTPCGLQEFMKEALKDPEILMTALKYKIRLMECEGEGKELKSGKAINGKDLPLECGVLQMIGERSLPEIVITECTLGTILKMLVDGSPKATSYRELSEDEILTMYGVKN